MAESEDPGGLARDAYTYLHLPIVAGVIAVAVADELLIAHPGAAVRRPRASRWSSAARPSSCSARRSSACG